MTTLSVIGLGYIGLPTAAVIASRKMQVFGVDTNPLVVETINKGQVHIVEPDLDLMVRAVVMEGYLQATLCPVAADVFLIAVPTPFKNDYQPDVSYIQTAACSIAPLLQPGNLVILESTSPVGTTELMTEWLAAARPDLTFPLQHGEQADIQVAYCPERVLPGHVLRELVLNDRVIGGITPFCSSRAKAFYEFFVEGACYTTDARTAELCKLTENSFRDVNIAFANELSMICDKLQINVWDLIRLANQHPRVNILQPGPGVGGHCIAVDPWFIVSSAPEESKLIKTARQVNDAKPDWVLHKAHAAVERYLKAHPDKTAADVTISCFGLAYKADIDDFRESPALAIAQTLALQHSGLVLVVEPNMSILPRSLADLLVLSDSDKALERSQIVLLLVDHKEFRTMPLEAWSNKQVLDVRGVLAHA